MLIALITNQTVPVGGASHGRGIDVGNYVNETAGVVFAVGGGNATSVIVLLSGISFHSHSRVGQNGAAIKFDPDEKRGSKYHIEEN